MKQPRFVNYFIAFAMTLFCANLFAIESLQINKVSVNPKTIDLTKNETIRLQFEITQDALVTITFQDEDGEEVKTMDLGLKKAGAQSVIWDGTGKDGKPVEREVVIYSIHAETKDHQKADYDPSSETGGFDLKFPEFSRDLKTGKISYVLPQAARVRLRAGILKDTLLATLIDWQPEEAGRHEFSWNGRDPSGEINLLIRDDLNLNLNAFSLPDNAILMKSAVIHSSNLNSKARPATPGKHFHYAHPRALCHEPRFKILFPETTTQNKVPISIVIDPRDEEDLIRKRFEVMVYLDTTFLFEEEQSLTPATFTIDLSKVTPGTHLLTVNVMSYDDHIGVQTVKIKTGAS